MPEPKCLQQGLWSIVMGVDQGSRPAAALLFARSPWRAPQPAPQRCIQSCASAALPQWLACACPQQFHPLSSLPGVMNVCGRLATTAMDGSAARGAQLEEQLAEARASAQAAAIDHDQQVQASSPQAGAGKGLAMPCVQLQGAPHGWRPRSTTPPPFRHLTGDRAALCRARQRG